MESDKMFDVRRNKAPDQTQTEISRDQTHKPNQASCHFPDENSARFSLNAPSGPGLSEHDPIALVVESEKRTEEGSQSEKLPERTDRTDIRYGKSSTPTQIVHSSALQYTIAFTYQREKEMKKQRLLSTRMIYR